MEMFLFPGCDNMMQKEYDMRHCVPESVYDMFEDYVEEYDVEVVCK
jgi:hypothetical protein